MTKDVDTEPESQERTRRNEADDAAAASSTSTYKVLGELDADAPLNGFRRRVQRVERATLVR